MKEVDESLATEMLREVKANSKRWFIIAIIELIILLFTITLFIAYLNTPIEETGTTYTQEADTEGKNSIVGRSEYDIGRICIEQNTEEQMLLTLKHELMHVWLYENGHKNQNNDEIFDYEDLCEYAALSNNSINRIVKEYLYAKNLSLLHF